MFGLYWVVLCDGDVVFVYGCFISECVVCEIVVEVYIDVGIDEFFF